MIPYLPYVAIVFNTVYKCFQYIDTHIFVNSFVTVLQAGSRKIFTKNGAVEVVEVYEQL